MKNEIFAVEYEAGKFEMVDETKSECLKHCNFLNDYCGKSAKVVTVKLSKNSGMVKEKLKVVC